MGNDLDWNYIAIITIGFSGMFAWGLGGVAIEVLQFQKGVGTATGDPVKSDAENRNVDSNCFTRKRAKLLFMMTATTSLGYLLFDFDVAYCISAWLIALSAISVLLGIEQMPIDEQKGKGSLSRVVPDSSNAEN